MALCITNLHMIRCMCPGMRDGLLGTVRCMRHTSIAPRCAWNVCLNSPWRSLSCLVCTCCMTAAHKPLLRLPLGKSHVPTTGNLKPVVQPLLEHLIRGDGRGITRDSEASQGRWEGHHFGGGAEVDTLLEI